MQRWLTQHSCVPLLAAAALMAAQPSWAQGGVAAGEQTKVGQYLQARNAFTEELATYWKSIADKRRVRNAKRRSHEPIALDDYVAKIRAAVSAKVDPNFLIIARTDSRAVLGYEEAIRRANAALEAGADMAFVEAPQTLDETANVPKLVKGPCMLNMVWKGKTPDLSMEEAAKLNYAFMILPGVLTRTIVGACDAALAEVKAKGRHPVPASDITPQQGFNLNGAAEWDRYRTQFRDTTKQAAE